MKKITSVLLGLLVALSGTSTAFAAGNDIVIGDADRDGAVKIDDVTLIQQYTAQLVAADKLDLTAADVNRDGVADVKDATIIQRYLAEFIENFDEWKPAEPAEPLTLDKTSLSLVCGESASVAASLACTFSSENNTVVTVDENGSITAVGIGTAVVTATDEYNRTAQCAVTVTAPETVSVDRPILALGVGETCTLCAAYDGKNPGYGAVFTSDKPSVATVDSQTGFVTANAVGYATITVTSVDGKTCKCWLTVRKAPSAVAFSNSKINMIAGEKAPFFLRPLHFDEALHSASYTSDNSSVVSVTDDGMVTAVEPGTATVTATAYNGKASSVTVTVLASAGNTKKTITSAVGLRTDAAWTAANIVIIPKGSTVTTFGTSDDGRWIKAQYGSNYGWIYNKALGVSKNYRDITVSTLPAVVDDLIFDCNLNLKKIYDTIYDTSYRNTSNDSIENLCVYWLNYRRGCCYHNSAMLYYVYNKIGVETIRLIGCNAYGARYEHAWCMCKTTSGWRHVDAHHFYEPPRSWTVQYFVTDSVYKNYQEWDYAKYPACE